MIVRHVVASCILSVLLLAAATPAQAFWWPDGNELCGEVGNQGNVAICSDGAGGSIIVWRDFRGGTQSDLYAQRLNGAGTPQWAPGGVVVCNWTGNQGPPVVVSDGFGGAIVAWSDFRDGYYWNVFAQRIDDSGDRMWNGNAGRPLAPGAVDQLAPAIVTDGNHGAVIAWVDHRNDVGGVNSDIYAQKITYTGAWAWGATGAPVCNASFDQQAPVLVADGAGGVIVAWEDWRSSTSWDVYAQRLNPAGGASWTANGVPVGTGGWHQQAPVIASDGTLGAIVAWQDGRSGPWKIYAQRLRGNGAPAWTAGGVPVCNASGDQIAPAVVADGFGGAVVLWQDDRGGVDADVYAQSLDTYGVTQWGGGGSAVCAAAGNQTLPELSVNASGNTVAGWMDDRGGFAAVYCQRLDTAGGVLWAADGCAASTITSDQTAPGFLVDAFGGVTVAWADIRSGIGWDVRAQFIDGEGRQGYLAANVFSVGDVPGDQGGQVRLTIGKSALDGDGEDYQILMYNVWQKIDGKSSSGMQPDPALAAVAAALAADGWRLEDVGGRYVLRSGMQSRSGSLPPGDWELVGSFAACQMDQYIYRAGTLADAVGDVTPYATFVVSAHTTTPSLWYASAPESGYSVDNLPPEPPGGFAGRASYRPDGLEITWELGAANDLAYYRLYRGADPAFEPGPENLLAATATPGHFDADWYPESGYCYKAVAIDIHENASGCAILLPANVTAVEMPAVTRLRLHPNQPNPFNPATTIRYDLPRAGAVKLAVYDAAGKLVRVLVDAVEPPGTREVRWDGRAGDGRQVASGIYVCQLVGAGQTVSRRMTLVR